MASAAVRELGASASFDGSVGRGPHSACNGFAHFDDRHHASTPTYYADRADADTDAHLPADHLVTEAPTPT